MQYPPVLLNNAPPSQAFPADVIQLKYDQATNRIIGQDWTGAEVPFSATVSGDVVATGNTGFTSTINADSLTANRNLAAPNAAGTISLDQLVTVNASAMVFTAAAYVNQTFAYTGAGTLATGSLALPNAANSRVGQVVKLFSHGIVTAFTGSVTGGGTIVGAALTALAADITYEWTCISTASTGTWARTK